MHNACMQVCARLAQLVSVEQAPPSLGGASAPTTFPGLGPAISNSDAARCLSTSVTLAAEHLLTAELRGVLCRDQGGPEGLRFYRNFFREAVMIS